MKKVGIITFHSAHNYGSVFQAYALQKIIINMGYKCEIIDLRTPAQLEVYSILTKRKGFKYLLKNSYYILHLRKRKIKHRRFEQFIDNKYILSERQYSSCDELMQSPPVYDWYISGSDQIWNLEPEDANLAYFLPFVKQGRKIAYAPSFGPIGNLKEQEKKVIKKLVKTYDCLSVREFAGKKLLEELTDKTIPIMVDPTMLLDRKEWDHIAKSREIKNDYIFFYTLFANSEMIKVVEKISKKLNMSVITPYVSNQYDITTNFIKVTDCGPEEFITYLKNAKLVLTSSFHGAVFSVLYKKPFYAIGGMQDKRINTLLNKMGLTDRAVTINEIDSKLDTCFDIDFCNSEAVLKKEKAKSIQYLEESL